MKTVIILIIIVGLASYLWFGLLQSDKRTKDQPKISQKNTNAPSPPRQSDVKTPELVEAIAYVGLNISIVAVSELDNRAIVTHSDGITQTMEVGDKVSGTNLELIQVAREKLVLKDSAEQALYFINKSQGNEVSQVMRLASQLTLRERPFVNKAVPDTFIEGQ